MKKTKRFMLLMFCIVAIRADEIIETIDIDIDVDISGNSASVNASAQAPISSSKTPSNTVLIASSGTTAAAIVSCGFESRTRYVPAITSAPTGSSVGTQTDSFIPKSSTWSGHRDLTGSASAVSPSQGVKQSNVSLWATGGLRPTASALPSPFSGKASAKKVSKEDVGLLMILGCIIRIFL